MRVFALPLVLASSSPVNIQVSEEASIARMVEVRGKTTVHAVGREKIEGGQREASLWYASQEDASTIALLPYRP